MRLKNRGFTLLELLVVIAIIGVLATIILASLATAKARSRDTRRIADLKQLQQGVENYFENNGTYPITSDLTSLYPTYLASAPKDPSGGNYAYAGTVTTYCIGTNLEASVPAGVGPSSSCTISGFDASKGAYKVGGP